MNTLYTLENKHWQVGILPQTGASLAFGRIRYNGVWVDVLRPTAPDAYDSASRCSSFIMLPWTNRIRAGQFQFAGSDYALKTASDDGTARHGDVRGRIWEVEEAHPRSLRLSFDSSAHLNVNFPFAFSAVVEYSLEKKDFSLRLTLRNEDSRAMPGGFGHHPYFVRPGGVNTPHLQIPCEQYFDLPADLLPVDAPKPIIPRLDFRQMQPLADTPLNDLLTGRTGDDPVRLVYPAWETEIAMYYDALFQHVLVYVPAGSDSLAIEPMTMATDGFNLLTRQIAGNGVFVLQPGEARTAAVRLHVRALS
ncbi:MAG: aldose epimerase [Anaerolineae bacterium]|jgi:aldose 1-epimerase|nr:aldose epimerase [Anaerolineae bacterium]